MREGAAVPTYQYACKECGHQFEAVQSFSDASLTECPQCTGPLRKLYGAVGVIFKGSGFYRTDSRSDAKSSAGSSKSSSSSSTGSSGDGGSSSGKSDSSGSSSGKSDSSSSSSSSSSTTAAAAS
jgi:putative FmdB family regulatory protein